MTIKSSRRLPVAACAAALVVGLWSAGAFAFMSSGGSSGNANADEEYRVAKTAIAQYDYQKAIDHLQKVLATTPDNADALNLMGSRQKYFGNPSRARKLRPISQRARRRCQGLRETPLSRDSDRLATS